MMSAKMDKIFKRVFALLLAAGILLSQAAALPLGAENAAVPPDSGLPVLYVNVDESAEGYGTVAEMNASPDHSVSCTGSISLDVPEGYTGDYSDAALSDLNNVKLEYIRGRGNSTWQADKKPYKIKLDKGQNLLGMGKNKHWVLLANRFDQSLLRNRLISYIGSAMGLAYTPKMLPVELVINGEYYGSYLLAEQIRVDKTRVNIDELGPEDNEEPEVSGGYLLALRGDADKPTEDGSFTTENGVGFLFESPEFDFSEGAEESGTQAQRDWICDYLQKTENAILGENLCDENGVSYQAYMDLQSAADFWWINIFSDSYDAFRTSSTYLYKPRNDKLYWGPLWDFDLTMGNGSAEGQGYNIGAPMLWLDELRDRDPAFTALLRERWQLLDGILEDIVRDDGVLDRMAEEIRISWQADADRWGEWIAAVKPLTDLDTEVRDLKDFIRSQREWMGGNLDDLSKVYYRIRFLVDGTEFSSCKLRVGQSLNTLPEAPEKEGYVFLGWMDENGEIVETAYGQKDISLSAKYRQIPPYRFEDVPAGSWYEQAARWAVEHWIVTGTSPTSFSPHKACTRAEFVTMLWRACGAEEPFSTECPFTDVRPDSYCYKAVLWAVENGFCSGTGETSFSPKKACTRAMAVTMIWNTRYRPEPEMTECPFTDVAAGKYYCKAVLWALEQGVAAGKSASVFAPNQSCTRAQAVSFLYKAAALD
ncbi:MAG: CotH kinase family protein [Oscillospiraceae bacterium]|nr:CotH kinase family protein [Oscillospiraceae bacterium]